ncbi:chymotrypsin BI-like [Zophobas morio]|uniref:chymotrypsin BI-like n=1 Tax=Zophobas morio TaxID=2755281 RepID=UPI0030838A60
MLPKHLLLLTITTVYSLPQQKLNPRIFNGEPATKGQFPWQVGLYIPRNTGLTFCGGSLISDTWVLTAAHCLADAFFSIRILLGTLKSTGDDPDQIELHSQEYLYNYDFDPWSYENDVALIKLPEPVVFTDYIQPILLASEEVDAGTGVTIIGWGDTGDGVRSSVLTYSNVTVAETCKDIGTVCTDSDPDSDAQNICGGDSGGPLVLNAFTYPVHIGITSFYSGACERGGYGGFTSTAYVREWIKTNTGI